MRVIIVDTNENCEIEQWFFRIKTEKQKKLLLNGILKVIDEVSDEIYIDYLDEEN